MNDRKSLYDIKSFYDKKAVLKSSFQGMRYQVEKSPQGEMLRVTVWEEPFCFEATPENQKQVREFAYSEEGLDCAYAWLCETYETGQARFLHAYTRPLLSREKEEA